MDAHTATTATATDPARAPGRIRLGIDTGGTFTDVVALDEESGALVTTKTPSTPADPAEGFMAAVDKGLALLGVAGSALTAISHGTTVATNQLLEDRIGSLGFVTTEGFEFVLEIARQSVPDGYGNSYFWVKPPRIVPAHLVRTVPGRLDHTGAELRPFDPEAAVAVARAFRDAGVRALGVCFLHSYANPDHELRMREVLRREHPTAVVSLSCEVLREYREYERSVTTLVDAAVKPRVAAYVAGIRERLERTAPGVPFYVMKSNGGVLSAAEVVHQPITTVLSGPAAGVLGAALVARAAGYDSVLTLDGGGTSTDVSVVLDGEPTLTTEGRVGRYPSKIPMVDVVTVGAGGGSVAWVSPEGTLKVGPRSAGADPGPMCYPDGGAEPTVTDAHVLLGRIPPHLLGGEIPLDPEAARAGLRKLAAELGLEPEACATGILEISAWNQANAIRQVTVERGLDVRDFVLTAFGGSGALLACRLADILGLRGVLVPRDPGNVSAFGLLTVDVRDDYVQTYVVRHDRFDPAAVTGAYRELEAQAAAALDAEGFPRDAHRYVRSADLRYRGQAFEVRVPAPDGEIGPAFAAAVLAGFHDAHERLYGYCYRDDPEPGHPERRPEGSAAMGAVEWVNLRVSGIGPIARPEPRPLPAGDDPDPAPARTGTRPVYFDAWADAPIYRRDRLAPGARIAGPAVIEEFGSTVPLHPGFAARVDRYGNLVLAREEATG
jgi:N-methylhydantoinase A